MYFGKLDFLPCGSITANGWLKEQLMRSKEGMGGNLYKLEPQMIYDPFIKQKSTSAWGSSAAGWGAEISGNYWYGLINLAFTLPDKELQDIATEWVEKVIASQEPDGYLGGYSKTDDRSEDYNAWGSYCGMRALLLYAEATGREDVFDAVYKGLLWFCRTEEWSFTSYAGHAMEKAMAYCYRKTGNKELLDFCNAYEEFLNKPENDTFRESINSFSDDDIFYIQSHAGGVAEFCNRPACVYLVDGDERKLKASVKIIDKVREKILMVNGGISGSMEWISPKSSTAETETCNSTTFPTGCAWLAAATGEAKYGDYIEKTVFNAVQGARKKDEKAITYFISPNQLCASDHSSTVHDPHGMYAPIHKTACCAVNSVVVMPEFVKNSAMIDKNGDLHIVNYGPVIINYKNAVIKVETLYPFRKDLTFKIRSNDGNSVDFNIYLKKPIWCENIEIKADGKNINEVNEYGFIKVEGGFADGDEIKVKTEMKPKVVEMDDTDGADKHPLSVVYGPLCFALPVKENWINKGNGYAHKELPEGFSWYEVQKGPVDLTFRKSGDFLAEHYWNFAVTRESLEENLKVTEIEAEGYVWEKPMVKIEVNGWYAPYLYPNYTPRTNEIYGKKVPVREKKTLELVPFGCTALRITCFPIADTSKIVK